MTQEEELALCQAERTAWREITYEKYRKVPQLQHEKQVASEYEYNVLWSRLFCSSFLLRKALAQRILTSAADRRCR